MSAYTINIQPYPVGQSSSKIDLFLQYVFNAVDATVYVYFKDDNNNTIKTVSVYVPSEIYASWQEDSVIIDYVLQELQLKAL